METLASSPALSHIDSTTTHSLSSADTHYSLPGSFTGGAFSREIGQPREKYKNLGESPYETSRVLPICYNEATIDKFHSQTQSFSSGVYEQMVIGPLTWKATNMEIRDLNKLKKGTWGNSSHLAVSCQCLPQTRGAWEAMRVSLLKAQEGQAGSRYINK